MKRLSAATSDLALDVEVPSYDRSAPPSIVHLGVGAFARAHLAVYADDLLRAGQPAAVGGVSLRTPRAEEQLGPQDGLFTVTEREPSKEPVIRMVASLTSVATGAAAAVEAIARPTTTLVTLTVTEKGYERAGPSATPAVLVAALDARRRLTDDSLVVASLDNLTDNGSVLRAAVLQLAEQVDDELAAWVSGHVRFPRSVVDRMVPATSDADRFEVGARLGLRDEAATITEAHRSWVIDRVEGLPALGDVGVQVVPDVTPYQQRKLWLLNLPHSALAYCGILAGHRTVADAAADPVIAAFVRGLVEEVLEVVSAGDLESAAFAADSMRRFSNAALGHTCVQVGADGSRKLAQRAVPVMERRRARGLGQRHLDLVVAAWLAALTGTAAAARPLPPVDDPAAPAVRDALRDRGLEAALVAAFGEGDVAQHAASIERAYRRVVQVGLRAIEDA